MSYSRMIEDIAASQANSTLELKQTRYLDAKLNGATAMEAAQMAGYIGREARTPVKLIETSELRARFQQIAEEKGLTLHKVADKISEHMEARAIDKLGMPTIAPDNRVQQKAIEQLTDLLGMKQAESKVAVAVQINFPAGLAERWSMDE